MPQARAWALCVGGVAGGAILVEVENVILPVEKQDIVANRRLTHARSLGVDFLGW